MMAVVGGPEGVVFRLVGVSPQATVVHSRAVQLSCHGLWLLQLLDLIVATLPGLGLITASAPARACLLELGQVSTHGSSPVPPCCC